MIRSSKLRLTLCGVLICWMLALIWGNSLLPGPVSGQLSGKLAHYLKEVLPVFSPSDDAESWILRKCAHFGSFFTLGLLLCWMFAMVRTRWSSILGYAAAAGICAAILDESIQRFVPERHGCIRDVILDSCGLLTGIALLLLILYFVKRPRCQ